MILAFKLHYETRWGQRLAVVGNAPVLGEDDPMHALLLDYQGGGYWGREIEVKDWPATLHYKYVLLEEEGFRIPEWGDPRRFELKASSGKSFVLLKDSWRARQHPEQALYTSAFQDVILQKVKTRQQKAGRAGKHPKIHFSIEAPQVSAEYRLALLGNTEELGSWDPDNAILLGSEGDARWQGSIVLRSGLGIEYKYGLADAKTGKLVHLETGDHRFFSTSWLSRERSAEVFISDTYFRHPTGMWRGTGVAMPVFSLRSEKGLGVGEFPDIKLLVDWAARVGMNMVQILPVNDTSATATWTDSYPYAAISVFALHPLYLNLDDLPEKKTPEEKDALEERRQDLNALAKVDYEAVMSFKLSFARNQYEKGARKFLKSSSFRKFMDANAHWLKAYAAFCYLRDRFGTVDFRQWGEYSLYDPALLEHLFDSESEAHQEIGFHYYLQYHLDRQLGDAAQYARERKIILKGDIPIGIYRYSADAWVAPELYNMSGQSGAPPDPFSDTGQNWGFPTYNWSRMAINGFRWWQQRLQQLSRYFDAFRIDHILGFFRIWEIPIEQVQGLMGHFNPALPVRIGEFSERGIVFDRERYCRPYIHWDLLGELFGSDRDRVRLTFLDEPSLGEFHLKHEFDTQRKIENFLAREENAHLRHLREGLFALVADILFFEVPESDGKAFHPRILMQKTPSFQDLLPVEQARLDDLYIDYFYRRQESFWRQQAMTRLPAIKAATNMLICGEDLGMVPDCVPGVMDELGILSLEIQRMSKNPETEFLSEADIPYMSVCSPSTHDMPPIRAWWEEMPPAARLRFFHEQLGFQGTAPLTCGPPIAEHIIRQHLHWPSMWAVFPIQDLLAMDDALRLENPFEERINIPANPKHYWRYRLHLNLEYLIEQDAFNGHLRQMITDSGRSATHATDT